MGKFFVDIIFILGTFSFFIPILFSCLKKNNTIINKSIVFLNLSIGIILGIIIHIIRIKNKKEMMTIVTKLNRYTFVVILFLLLVAFTFIIINNLIHKENSIKKLNTIIIFLISLSCSLIIYLIIPQLLNLSLEFISFGENGVSNLTLFRILGYIFGVLVSFMMSISIYKVLINCSKKMYNLLFNSIFIITFFNYLIKGISALARLKNYLKKDFNINPIITEKSNIFGVKVFDIMIFEDKSSKYFILAYFIILFICTIYYILNLKVIRTNENNAEFRKKKWIAIVNRRWALSSILLSFIMLFSVTYLNYYLTKPVELTKPEAYQEQGDNIIISLSKVDDGHLHRFSYKKDGHDIRFIIVKKPNSTAYGVGLDACQICGVAGYYERKNDVVCKRCDVIMNKATIGFKGGCNPIPFEFKIEDSKIIIDKKVLEVEKERFPVGE